MLTKRYAVCLECKKPILKHGVRVIGDIFAVDPEGIRLVRRKVFSIRADDAFHVDCLCYRIRGYPIGYDSSIRCRRNDRCGYED